MLRTTEMIDRFFVVKGQRGHFAFTRMPYDKNAIKIVAWIPYNKNVIQILITNKGKISIILRKCFIRREI